MPKPETNSTAIAGSSRTTCSPSYYTFRNKDGQTIQLRGDLTMEDLVRMGYRDIRLVQPETPLKPHEWRADSSPENANVDLPDTAAQDSASKSNNPAVSG